MPEKLVLTLHSVHFPKGGMRCESSSRSPFAKAGFRLYDAPLIASSKCVGHPEIFPRPGGTAMVKTSGFTPMKVLPEYPA